jgi:hypothetical protein
MVCQVGYTSMLENTLAHRAIQIKIKIYTVQVSVWLTPSSVEAVFWFYSQRASWLVNISGRECTNLGLVNNEVLTLTVYLLSTD